MTIEEQRSLLESTLSKLVDSDYVYLDIPGYFNIGDQLIFLGARQILNTVVPFKCNYCSIVENIRDKKIHKNEVIILQGGGNWGDGHYTPFRNKIISSFLDNKIVIMPQTIRYFSDSRIEKDAELYANHPNLHLCARDNKSFALLKEYFSANNIYCLPDSAVGLVNCIPKWTDSAQNKSLFIKRIDQEAALEEWNVSHADVKDWGTILEELNFNRFLKPYMGIRKVRKWTGNAMLKELANRYFVSVIEPFFLRNIPLYFLRYEKLYTTRLHGLILAKLMNMPVEYQDTRYGKISGYCETWF